MSKISQFDKTLKDLGRKDLNLRQYDVNGVLPDYIVSKYPKFVSFISEYYGFENEPESPSRLIDELFNTRDITQTDLSLLELIEDEYLLGQNYFQGFTDKRASAKYSNTLYRSKGTKYSITQFFRTFFEIEPDVVYTKEQVFFVGEDKIGPDSQRYLTNDKLYQKYAILIKSELSLDKWKDPYKLFVHPAGMYLGASLQIVGVAELDDLQYDPGKQLTPPNEIEGTASMLAIGYANHSALVDVNREDLDGDPLYFRIKLGHNYPPDPAGDTLTDHEDRSLEELDRMYSSIGELLEVNSPTLDDDDDQSLDSDQMRDEFDVPRTINGMDLSSGETIDQEVWVINPEIQRIDVGHNGTWGQGSLMSELPVGDSDSELTLNELLNLEGKL